MKKFNGAVDGTIIIGVGITTTTGTTGDIIAAITGITIIAAITTGGTTTAAIGSTRHDRDGWLRASGASRTAP